MSPETNAVPEGACNAASTTTAAVAGSSKCSNSEATMSAPTKICERSVAAQQAAPTSPLAEPLSPATSSSSASQSTGSSSALAAADATFEPTIDMMVNDFDDEQTLNEEEALAELELQDPHDEIATLREESEMPIEELLAKYQSMPIPEAPTAPWRQRLKKKKKGAAETQKYKRSDAKAELNELAGVENISQQHNVAAEAVNGNREKEEDDVIVIESGDEDFTGDAGGVKSTVESREMEKTVTETNVVLKNVSSNMKNTTTNATPLDKQKSRRSHLLDLYPGEYTTATASSSSVAAGEAVEKEIFSCEDDEEDDDDDEDGEEEDDEADGDYVKKTIMVGTAYQAVIPDGLSQYGDVLPYENEDKLVWEPSQVSEREVEQFLLNSRDIKPTLSDELMIPASSLTCDEAISRATPPAKAIEMKNGSERESSLDCGKITEDFIVQMQKQQQGQQTNQNKVSAATLICESEADLGAVVKDNEQALHLLVQCGYDFKEALRRKRLNAVPLTGSMSLWSEEECHKFEEGIQKFGKDFLKIRQNQVRTRTMRELVQFYYLWKKSERRDHDFANSDTVDHMDIYLNEGGDYATNATASTSAATGGCLPTTVNTAPPAFGTRKANAQKNISIMTGSNVASSSCSSNLSTANASSTVGAAVFANRKRIALSGVLLSSNCISDNQSTGSPGTAHSAK